MLGDKKGRIFAVTSVPHPSRCALPFNPRGPRFHGKMKLNGDLTMVCAIKKKKTVSATVGKPAQVGGKLRKSLDTDKIMENGPTDERSRAAWTLWLAVSGR